MIVIIRVIMIIIIIIIMIMSIRMIIIRTIIIGHSAAACPFGHPEEPGVVISWGFLGAPYLGAPSL